MSGGQRRTARAKRGRGVATLLLLAGVALVAGSAFVPWGRRDYDDPLTGPRTVTLNGGDVLPALVPLALVILAAWAAAAISRGVLRRILGLCAGLSGLAVVAVAPAVAWRLPGEEFAALLRRPAEAMGEAQPVLWGVSLAVIGAVCACIGGLWTAVARGAARSRGAGYDAHDAPAARREAARREAHGQAPATSMEAAAERWWRAMDVGVDPTDSGLTPGHDGTGEADTMGTPAFPVDEETTR